MSQLIFGEGLKLKSIFETIFSSQKNHNPFLKELYSMVTTKQVVYVEAWKKLKDKLPKKILFSKNKKEKFISLKYEEFWDERNLRFKNFILIIKDITEFEKLLENRETDKKRNIIISELVPEKGRNLEKHK